MWCYKPDTKTISKITDCASECKGDRFKEKECKKQCIVDIVNYGIRTTEDFVPKDPNSNNEDTEDAKTEVQNNNDAATSSSISSIQYGLSFLSNLILIASI